MEQCSNQKIGIFVVIEFLGTSQFARSSKYIECMSDIVIRIVLYWLEYAQYITICFHQQRRVTEIFH